MFKQLPLCPPYHRCCTSYIWEFPKIRGTMLGCLVVGNLLRGCALLKPSQAQAKPKPAEQSQTQPNQTIFKTAPFALAMYVIYIYIYIYVCVCLYIYIYIHIHIIYIPIEPAMRCYPDQTLLRENATKALPSTTMMCAGRLSSKLLQVLHYHMDRQTPKLRP